jgi:hypothetical protein
VRSLREGDTFKAMYETLGGNQAVVMTGNPRKPGRVKWDAETLTLTFEYAGSKHSKWLKFRYDRGLDLYDMTFLKPTRSGGVLDFKEVESHTGVYADQVRPIFEQATGLFLTMGTMRKVTRPHGEQER